MGETGYGCYASRRAKALWVKVGSEQNGLKGIKCKHRLSYEIMAWDEIIFDGISLAPDSMLRIFLHSSFAFCSRIRRPRREAG